MRSDDEARPSANSLADTGEHQLRELRFDHTQPAVARPDRGADRVMLPAEQRNRAAGAVQQPAAIDLRDGTGPKIVAAGGMQGDALDDAPDEAASETGAPRIGSVLRERYRLISVIGRGGMADVFRGADELLDRPVAVKVFRPGTDRQADRKRFLGEVHTLAGLSHQHLVALYDGGQHDAQPWCVMQLVDGGTLADRLGPLDPAEVAGYAAQIADGLAYIHERRIVHRDVKPSNVLLDHEGGAYLSDFGVAQMIDATRMTSTGALLGTAAYLSPEQVRGEPATPAVDVYALGLVVLESITGRREYPGAPVESAVARLSRQPVLPADLDDNWRRLLTAMTSADPESRPSAADAARTLRALSLRSAEVPFDSPPSGLPRVPAPSRPGDGTLLGPVTSGSSGSSGPVAAGSWSARPWTPTGDQTHAHEQAGLPPLNTMRPEYRGDLHPTGTDSGGVPLEDDAAPVRFGRVGHWVTSHTAAVMVGLSVLVTVVAVSVPALNRSGGLIQLDSPNADTQSSLDQNGPGDAAGSAGADWDWQANQAVPTPATTARSRGAQQGVIVDPRTATTPGRPANTTPVAPNRPAPSSKPTTPSASKTPSSTTPPVTVTTPPATTTPAPTHTPTKTEPVPKPSETTTTVPPTTPPTTPTEPSTGGGGSTSTGTGSGGGGLEIPPSGPATGSP